MLVSGPICEFRDRWRQVGSIFDIYCDLILILMLMLMLVLMLVLVFVLVLVLVLVFVFILMSGSIFDWVRCDLILVSGPICEFWDMSMRATQAKYDDVSMMQK